MAAAQLIQFSIYFFDTVMIARISPADVAAAALGSVVYFLFWMIGSAHHGSLALSFTGFRPQ